MRVASGVWRTRRRRGGLVRPQLLPLEPTDLRTLRDERADLHLAPSAVAVARKHSAASAGCGRAVERRTRRVLAHSRAESAALSCPSSAKAGAAHARHHVLSQEPPAAGPDSVHQLRIEKREGGDGVRVWIHSAEGFDRLVEMGVVEAHPGPRPSTTSSLPIGWGFVNRNPVERN